MKIAGLSTNQPYPTGVQTKDNSKGKEKSPFASLLNKVNENTNSPSVMKKDPKTGELVQPTLKETKAILEDGEVLSLEKLEELLSQLVEQGLIPKNLDSEMLQQPETLRLLELLPEDLAANLKQLFEEGTSVQDLMFSNGEQLPLVNIVASLIYLNHASQTQVNREDNSTLLPFFQQLTSQLNKVEGGIQVMLQPVNEDLAKELEAFLSRFHAKLTGQQAIAIDSSNSKLEYVKALYQRTLGSEDVLNNNTQNDSSAKVMLMGVEPQTTMNRVQQFALYVEPSSKPVNQEQFIKDFQNILAKSSLQNGTNGMRLLIKLYPEQLGSLRIELIQQQGTLVARMIASSSQAKELLESQLQGLKNAFASQNIQVEKLEIINSAALGQQFERSFDREGNGQQGFSGRESKKDDDQSNESRATFEEALKEELLNTEV